MKADVCVAYWTLFFISLFSSCFLFLFVAAELQKGPVPSKKPLESYVPDAGEIGNLSNATNIPDLGPKQVDPASEEIRGSFDDLTVLTVKPSMKTDEEILKSTGFKYTTIAEGLSESGDGVMVTLMEQGLGGGQAAEHVDGGQAQNASSGPPPAVQDKGGGSTGENTTDHPHDDIPSFSEWAKKQIAEAEKNKGENLTTGGNTSLKLRSKNYASTDCGAKVLAANPESISPGSVLSTSRDEYILSPCNARIWFIVELCEPIQPQRIEVANFELFSSSPKEFSVHLSDRYPTRDWTLAATLTAKDERTVQMFSLPHLPQFAKFIKIELHSHYGTEHYCPVSLFRAYGTSELEVLETVEDVAAHSGGSPTEEEEEGEGPEGGVESRPQNLFGSARDAVLSIVKKAAEVLVVKSQGNVTCKEVNSTAVQTQCVTPGYLLVCDNCTDQFFYKVYHLLCCHQPSLQTLMQSRFVSTVLLETNICADIGLEWPNRGAPLPLRARTSYNRKAPARDYLKALFPMETVTALCNMLAVSHRKVVLNVSQVAQEKPYVEVTTRASNVSPPAVAPGVADTTSPGWTETMPTVVTTATPAKVYIDQETNSVGSEMSDPATLISPTRTLTDENMSEEPSMSAPPEPVNETMAETGNELTSSLETPSPTIEVTPSIVSKPTLIEGTENKTVNETQSSENNVLEDSVGADTLTLDSLFSDMELDSEQTTAKATATPPQHIQKESVFVRLANRIKALERNMSLSGQYLEELSRRYKRQVEELQRALAGVLEEKRASTERESVQAKQLAILAHRVDKLTSAVGDLIMERESWANKASLIGQHGLIILIEVTVFVLVMLICKWVNGGSLDVSDDDMDITLTQSSTPPVEKTDNSNPPTRKRRPSEEVARTLVAEPEEDPVVVNGIQRKLSKCEVRRRKRRRKEREAPGPGSGERENIGFGVELVGGRRDRGEECIVPIRRASSESGWSPPAVAVGEVGTMPPPAAAPLLPPPPPTPAPTPAPAPVYIKTALWSRKQRISQSQQPSSSQETISSASTPPKPHKKPGPLKKIVKKLF